jgi:ADP-heptose:LPS heptosyltransferase
VRSRTRSDILDWTGRTTLQELSALLSMCTAIVTNDSGPMHVAQAVKIPVISIFGPTDPARCGPWLGEVEPLQVGLDCMKCYRKSCWHLSCMQQLKPDAVVERLSSCIGNIQ